MKCADAWASSKHGLDNGHLKLANFSQINLVYVAMPDSYL